MLYLGNIFTKKTIKKMKTLNIGEICSLCNNKPVIFARSYSGERLCKKCFLNSIENKIKKTISKYKMFKYNDKIALAVSVVKIV